MKAILRLLPVLGLVIVMMGCASQKRTAKTNSKVVESEMLHKQAVEALESRRFIIRADGEFHFPYAESRLDSHTPAGDAPVKYSANNFLSMLGDRAVLQFAPDLFPGFPLDDLNIEDKAAELKCVKNKKNGDQNFRMQVNGSRDWQKHRILITLFRNTNICSVMIYTGSTESNYFTFNGVVLPAD